MRGQEMTVGLLGRTLLLGDFGRYRLEKVLGGGLISLVYQGVKEAGEGPSLVAVKVLRAGSDQLLEERFRGEYVTLLCLEAAETGHVDEHKRRLLTPKNKESDQERDQRLIQQAQFTFRSSRPTQYFPRAFHFAPDYTAYGGLSYQVLVMEYVPAPPLSLMAASYEGRRLPEELALAAVEQYAQMLCILHGINLTCADRKLDDIRWREGGEDGSQLIVLDWNVVDEGPAGRPADLFRFGLLWHHLLLGIEPRFERHEAREGHAWKLLVRLEREPGWETLSFGTQGLLRRAMHPEPSQRYQRAEELLRDVQIQRELWSEEPQDLRQQANDWEQDKRYDAALRAISVALKKVPDSEQLRQDFVRLSTQVHKGKERLWQEVQRQIRYGQYDRAERSAVETMATDVARNDLELTVLLIRHRILAAACARGVEAGESPVQELRENLLQALLDLDDERRFDQAAPIVEQAVAGQGAFAQALARLLPEIKWRRYLRDARILETTGNHQDARKWYLEAVEQAEKIKSEETGYWDNLVKLLGDPAWAATEAGEEGEQHRRAEMLLRGQLADMRLQVNKAIKEGTLDLIIFHLRELLEAFPGDEYGERERTRLRRKLLSLARTPVAAPREKATPSALSAEGPAAAPFAEEEAPLAPSSGPLPEPDDMGMSLSAYLAAFPGDEDFRSSLETILANCAKSVADKSKEAKKWQAEAAPAVRRQAEEAWSTAWGYALRGEGLADLLKQKWPAELAPDALKARFEGARDERRALERLRRYYPQAVRADMGKEKALLEWAQEHGLEPFEPGLSTQQLLEDVDLRARVRKQLDEAIQLYVQAERAFPFSPAAAGDVAAMMSEKQEEAEEKMRQAAQLCKQALCLLEELETQHDRLATQDAWQGIVAATVDGAVESLRAEGQQILASIQRCWQERFDSLRKDFENALRSAHDLVAAESLFRRAAVAAEALSDGSEMRAQLMGLRTRLDEAWRQAAPPHLKLADEWLKRAQGFQEEHPALALECLLVVQAKLREAQGARGAARVEVDRLERLLAEHQPRIVERLREQLVQRVEETAQRLGAQAAKAYEEERMEDALTTLEQALFLLPTLKIDQGLLQERYDTRATKVVARALYHAAQRRLQREPDLEDLDDIINDLKLARRLDTSDDEITVLLNEAESHLEKRQADRYQRLDQRWKDWESAWKTAIAKPEGLAEAAQLLDKLSSIVQADPAWPTQLSEMRQQQAACEQFVEESKRLVDLCRVSPEKMENKKRCDEWIGKCDAEVTEYLKSLEKAGKQIPGGYWRELYQVLNQCLDIVGRRYPDQRVIPQYLMDSVGAQLRG